jgi:3-mercaptopyruvate sulfurtransferase SseA
MKKRMKAALAGIVALAAGTMAFAQSNPSVVITPTTQPAQAQAAARRISRDAAQKLVKEGKAVYVDVRAADQYALGHIKGALSVPASEIIARFREIPARKMIITYCA